MDNLSKNTKRKASSIAAQLAELYAQPFGGKPTGRFRVSPKLMRRLAGRRRLTEEFIQELGNEMFELGFVLVDLELFYAIVSVQSFGSYRRLGDAQVETILTQQETISNSDITDLKRPKET